MTMLLRQPLFNKYFAKKYIFESKTIIADAYIDCERYVIAKDENGQEIGNFPLPDIGAKIQKYTDSAITIECESGLIIDFDENGNQLGSRLHGYKF